MPANPTMRPAARLLLTEAEAIRPILDSLREEDFDRATVLEGWSVRDVLAHCAAALTRAAADDLHRFTPDDNQVDVDARKDMPVQRVVDELYAGYAAAAVAIDGAGGRLDGLGLGEWVHGGDVRDAVGAADPYTSPGVELALPLLVERSRLMKRPGIESKVGNERLHFGVDETTPGHLVTDLETFVRLCSGRPVDAERYELSGVSPAAMVLFT